MLPLAFRFDSINCPTFRIQVWVDQLTALPAGFRFGLIQPYLHDLGLDQLTTPVSGFRFGSINCPTFRIQVWIKKPS